MTPKIARPRVTNRNGDDTRTFICGGIAREDILDVMSIIQTASDGITHASSPSGTTYDLYLQGAHEERIGENEIPHWTRFVGGVIAALAYKRGER